MDSSLVLTILKASFSKAQRFDTDEKLGVATLNWSFGLKYDHVMTLCRP